jgi:hypothetical protein
MIRFSSRPRQARRRRQRAAYNIRMAPPPRLHIEPTADPDLVKITFDRQLPGLGSCFRSAEEARSNPLAREIFSIRGVRQVFMLGDFLTVRKDPDADWRSIGPAIQVRMLQVLG